MICFDFEIVSFNFLLQIMCYIQCCPPPPNAATPRDFRTPPPVIFRGVKRREIGNFIAIADE